MVDSSSLGGLSTLPIPKLTVNQETQQQALHQLALNLDNPVIGLCPGAEFGPAKQWPTKHYAEVAQHAVKQGYQVWLFGSKKTMRRVKRSFNSLAKNNEQNCIIWQELPA